MKLFVLNVLHRRLADKTTEFHSLSAHAHTVSIITMNINKIATAVHVL